jgi:hypothetical protein
MYHGDYVHHHDGNVLCHDGDVPMDPDKDVSCGDVRHESTEAHYESTARYTRRVYTCDVMDRVEGAMRILSQDIIMVCRKKRKTSIMV